jgi:hypothetical protein
MNNVASSYGQEAARRARASSEQVGTPLQCACGHANGRTQSELVCRWCLCVARWKEALSAGVAPPVYLDGCHEKALEFVTMQQLQQHALQGADAYAGGSDEEKALHDEI